MINQDSLTDTVPTDLIDLELAHRDAKARYAAAVARFGTSACGYAAYRAGQAVAKHPWLTQHPGTSPERRAARKALKSAADAATTGAGAR